MKSKKTRLLTESGFFIIEVVHIIKVCYHLKQTLQENLLTSKCTIGKFLTVTS